MTWPTDAVWNPNSVLVLKHWLSMEPPLPVPWPFVPPLAHQHTRPFFFSPFPSILKDHSSHRASEILHGPSSHLRVLGLSYSKMLELGIFKVIHSSCRHLLLCMWCLWKQMKQQAEDKPRKSCWHIVCFTKVQILYSRMQQQNSCLQTKTLSYRGWSTSQERKKWISPTLASSQSSLTGDVSINQPQSHLQKGSILIIKHHLHRAVNLKCALQK